MQLDLFLRRVAHPLVIVGSLTACESPAVAKFLIALGAPVYVEGISLLRNDLRLAPLRIYFIDNALAAAPAAGYPIDGILRIGGIPTTGLWRTLEEMGPGKINVCSISRAPFAGLSWGDIQQADLATYFPRYPLIKSYRRRTFRKWQEFDCSCGKLCSDLYNEEPTAEPSLIHELSKIIPPHSLLFLGSSLPIREWDGHASHENKELRICANRGVNGIDGTISTFLGLAAPQQNNWAIVGDLTALYDMAAFWVLPQLQDLRVTIVIVNNQGGQIFASIYPEKHFQNPHTVSFSHLAALWQVDYQRWTAVESPPANNRNCIIELIPDNSATARFSDKLQQRKQQLLADMSLAKANVLC